MVATLLIRELVVQGVLGWRPGERGDLGAGSESGRRSAP
jgi:hypothetical protein